MIEKSKLLNKIKSHFAEVSEQSIMYNKNFESVLEKNDTIEKVQIVEHSELNI